LLDPYGFLWYQEAQSVNQKNMNLPRSLGKALALSAAALTTSCDPGRCEITKNSPESDALYSAQAVRESCARTRNQVIDCFVISEDGKHIFHRSANCDNELNATLDSAFNPCIEDKGNTCVCYDGDGAEAKCTE